MTETPYVPPGAELTRFFRSDAPIRAVIGPAYGGRKVCCVHDIVQRLRRERYARQQHWRWVVIGPTRADLDARTIPTLAEWLPVGEWNTKTRTHGLEYRLDDGILRSFEIKFLGLDSEVDRQALKTIEATAVWLDNARAIEEAVFDRAREIAGSFPPRLVGGPAWSGIIASSRMPKPGHWLITRSQGFEADIELYRQPGGRQAEAENLENLKTRGFSYARMAAELDPDRARIEVDAELGASSAETALEADREEARNSMTKFVAAVMPDIVPAVHHQKLIDALERVARGELKRLMFFLPPGSAKSTYGSILFPSWFLGRNPTEDVILGSHMRDLAKRFGRRVRNIVASPQFRDIFGVGVAGFSAAAGEWTTTRGGEFYAVGVDSAVTGRRAGLGIIDDPIKGRAEADSLTVRQHTFEWYKSDFWPRLKPHAALIYIATRWNDDDLAGRLIEEAKNGGEQWEIISIPAEAIAGQVDPLGRQPGERLWPEWFTEEQFAQAKLDARMWSALYQQNPMPESGDYFKNEWIRWYDHAPPREEMKTYGASDCAVTTNGGDYTVHVVVGVDPHDDMYLLDLWRDRTSSDVWVDAQLDLIKTWKTLAWGEEKGQIARGVGPLIEKRSRERKIYQYRKQFPSFYDKGVRAQPIRGRMAQGKVYFPKRAPWSAALVHEILRFPAGVSDDQVDAFALIGQMLDILVPGSKPKQKPVLRTARDLTMDEIIELTGPGGRYGSPVPGRIGYRHPRI